MEDKERNATFLAFSVLFRGSVVVYNFTPLHQKDTYLGVESKVHVIHLSIRSIIILIHNTLQSMSSASMCFRCVGYTHRIQMATLVQGSHGLALHQSLYHSNHAVTQDVCASQSLWFR